MNVNLRLALARSFLFLLVLAAGSATALQGQSTGPYKNLVTAINTPVFDTLSGLNLNVYVSSPAPKHGTVTKTVLSPGGNGNPATIQLKYQPDAGFTGVDTVTVELIYTGNYPFQVYQAYRVSVFPSLLNPRSDFAVTTTGTPVSIDVLANDSGSNGPLSLSALTLTNHGSANIAGNNVIFTPDPGYTGIAHLSYTVCDALLNCKSAPVTIGVNNNMAPTSDTMQVATAKNTPLNMPLTYNGYSLFQGPTNGSVTIQNGQSFRYTPNLNFTGSDQFVLSNGPTVFKTVNISVLNTPTQNTMAMDDYVFTPKNTPITFNVRDNDIGNLSVKSWVTPSNLAGTISPATPNGTVTFTPNNNFSGVATFYYKIGNMFVSDLEMAAVNVVVGNLPPSAATFDLTTPKNTPMVINYQIPFIGFDFAIADAPDHGAFQFYPGYSTQTINGQTVSGNNLLIYTPQTGFVGTDQMEINYCVTSNGQCQLVKITTNVVDVVSTSGPYCVDDCVWAGDINYDGKVNNKDLLPLGYFMGMDGEIRNNASLEWYGQYADNWNNPYTGCPTDLKHADTDGNGLITAEDTLALMVFYGQTHNLTPVIPPTSKALPFFFNVLTPNPGIGDLVQVEVSLGNSSLPLTNLYGFTLDVSLSSQIQDSLFQMRYFANTWLNMNAPYLCMSKRPAQGRVESAFTRINGTSVSGYGLIGQFDFVIIDIVEGAKPSDQAYAVLSIDSPTMMWADGSNTTGETLTLKIPIDMARNSAPVSVSNQDFLIYPSPVSDLLNIHLNGEDFMESVSILDAMGRAVYQSGPVQWEHAEINVGNLPEGFYVITAHTGTGQVTKKFQVAR